MGEIHNRLNKLIQMIRNEQFQTLSGMGNEVPFYIFNYNPESELEVRDYINESILKGDKYLLLDVYELTIQALKELNVLESLMEKEQVETSMSLFEAFDSLDIISEVINLIEKKLNRGHSLLVLIGFGKVFPIFSTKDLLSKFESLNQETPSLILYPGTFEKSALSLFGKIEDGNVYRLHKLNI